MRRFHHLTKDDLHITLDPTRPHWFAGNDQAMDLFERWHLGHDEAALIRHYQKLTHCPTAKAVIYVTDFLSKLDRIDMKQREAAPDYLGRSQNLHLDRLSEL